MSEILLMVRVRWEGMRRFFFWVVIISLDSLSCYTFQYLLSIPHAIPKILSQSYSLLNSWHSNEPNVIVTVLWLSVSHISRLTQCKKNPSDLYQYGNHSCDIPIKTPRVMRLFDFREKFVVWVYEFGFSSWTTSDRCSIITVILPLLGFSREMNLPIGSRSEWLQFLSHQTESNELIRRSRNDIFDSFEKFLFKVPSPIRNGWNISGRVPEDMKNIVEGKHPCSIPSSMCSSRQALPSSMQRMSCRMARSI